MNTTSLRHSLLLLGIAGCVCAGDTQRDPAAPPAPVVPLGPDGEPLRDALGESFLAPGPFPDQSTSTLIRLALSGTGDSKQTTVQVLNQGRISATVNWANKGDLDLNLSPALPDDPRTYPTHHTWDFQKNTSGHTNVLSGPPTYAWAPHGAQGLLLCTVAQHPEQNSGKQTTWVEAHAAGVYGTERRGPAYNMLDGKWRPSPDIYSSESAGAQGNMWITSQHIGVGTEANADIGVVWLPYTDDWIGGYVSPLATIIEHLPDEQLIHELRSLEAVPEALQTLNHRRQLEGTPIPWVKQSKGVEIYTEAIGTIKLDGGQYELVAAGDDAFVVELETENGWQKLVGIDGIHQMLTDSRVLQLPSGESRIRVRYFQATSAWGLQVALRGQEFESYKAVTFTEPPEVRVYDIDPGSGGSHGWIRNERTDTEYHSPGLPYNLVRWRGADRWRTDRLAVADINASELNPDDGVLIAQGLVNNMALLTTVRPPSVSNRDWSVQITDSEIKADGPTSKHSRRNFGFQFAFIPFDRPEAAAARVDGSSGTTIASSQGLETQRIGIGQYRVRGEAVNKDGIMILQPELSTDAPLDEPDNVFATWHKDAQGDIIIQTRKVDHHSKEYPLVDQDFSFAWFPFEI